MRFVAWSSPSRPAADPASRRDGPSNAT
ncbi:hypothetical protein R2601_03383 [Salipiger bermudensis HTCC2601]|uniref:Uncharacterized protein n=1 Tax=Salipiger bermudensis (strain DSM 26914 / JCM 13377 / KCTC 12554 / HTCC2601) TaxID=314265 RepID=Q0FWG9_SALBH|nr:hypothetical protein R2601_03383 [Salipiger bermudensis HTCC2601]